MALLYTEEQKELIALVRDMAEHEIKPYVQEADEKGECPRELFDWGFKMGLHMLEIPAQYGGTGLSYETTAMIFEELAKVMQNAYFVISTFNNERLIRQSGAFLLSGSINIQRNPGRDTGTGTVFCGYHQQGKLCRICPDRA